MQSGPSLPLQPIVLLMPGSRVDNCDDRRHIFREHDLLRSRHIQEICLTQLPVCSTNWICDFKCFVQSDSLSRCRLCQLLVATLWKEQLLGRAAVCQEGQGRATRRALLQYLHMHNISILTYARQYTPPAAFLKFGRPMRA